MQFGDWSSTCALPISREPGQQVLNYRSDRWIALKFFLTSFRRLFSMELRGIGTTRRRRPVGAIPPTALENRANRSITIDPTDHWIALKFFHEFPKAVFEGVSWNWYDTLTVSDWGHSTDNAREPGQQVLNYRSDRWIALKFFLTSFWRLFSMKLRGIGTTS